MQNRSLLALPFLFLTSSAFAEPTLELRLSGPTEVFPGDPESASVDAPGRIGMGPVATRLTADKIGAVVVLAADKRSIYAGTAGGGLLEIDPAGKTKKLISGEKTVISALAFHRGHLFAANGPDGAIVEIEPDGKVKPYADPSPKYIWAMLSDPKGLIVATGEPGNVLEIGDGGKTKVLFEPGETHVRALIRHPNRGIIAGGGQKGIVYQLKPEGGAHALYDSGMEEVSSFAIDPKTGDLYAAFVSESKAGALAPDKMIGAVAGENEGDSPIKGSEVVRIAPSGRVDLLWSSRQEGALALVWDEATRRLLLSTGTGPKARGRIYAIDTTNRDRVMLLTRVEPPLASALVPAPSGGALVVGTAPVGQVVRIGPGLRSESTWVSSEQDLHRISRIGRLWFDADVPAGAEVKLSLRTGNTRVHDKTWSEWSAPVAVADGGPISVPQGRFAQFRVQLHSSDKGKGPLVKSVHASIIRANVAPNVLEVFVLRRGVYMKPMPKEEEREKTVTVTPSQISRLRQDEEHESQDVRVRQGSTPGMLTASWRAEDRNGDELLFRLEVRRLDQPGQNEPGRWVRLADNIEPFFYSFDSKAFADGRYQLRVVASDRPSNPPSEALTDENQSEPFLIDNGPPHISTVHATSPAGGRMRVEAEAEDTTSALGQAEFSLDGGPWLMLPAADGLVDSKKEKFLVEVKSEDKPGEPRFLSGKHTVQVRVEDEAGNSATASTQVDVP
jgi:hypothetical protein